VISSVQKRSFRKNGKLRETRNYYLRYRIGDMPSDKWVSLGVTDKQVAEKMAADFIRERERENAGIIEPKLMRDAAKKPLREHLDDYLADLVSRGRAGRGGRGARQVKSRVTRLVVECRWALASNVTADSFVAWRSRTSGSPRTLNHFLQTMVSFLNWMERAGRIKSNPLRHVGKVDERGKAKRVRRAFTDEELTKLVQGSGTRGIIYYTAARTGLRQEELRQLTWGDVFFDAKVPHLIVRASVAKNKKEEAVQLMPEMVDLLREYRPVRSSHSDRVFLCGIPRACRLRKDAEPLGIPYQDERGRFADFHALRYTWGTFLQRCGISQQIAMRLMRHSDIKLTSRVYTDETQLPIYEAIKDLPRLLTYTQIRAQISGAEGRFEAVPVATGEGLKTEDSSYLLNEKPVFIAENGLHKMERAKGFEPSTFTLAR
jgi:integrase